VLIESDEDEEGGQQPSGQTYTSLEAADNAAEGTPMDYETAPPLAVPFSETAQPPLDAVAEV